MKNTSVTGCAYGPPATNVQILVRALCSLQLLRIDKTATLYTTVRNVGGELSVCQAFRLRNALLDFTNCTGCEYRLPQLYSQRSGLQGGNTTLTLEILILRATRTK